jgi:arylsulfatase A-like enzyme
LFGYTDQSVDPRLTDGPWDTRLQSYEGVLPGFADGVRLAAGDPLLWTDWLKSLGYTLPDKPDDVLSLEPQRPAEHSMSAFLTDRFLAWLDTREAPWFAHLSQFRPHSPYAAAGHFSKMYDPDAVDLPIAPSDDRHWLHEGLLQHPLLAAPKNEGAMRRLRAQYYGMVSEADHQLGRVWAALKARGAWDDTLIVVTSDHGEQLGDHGLLQKLGFFEASFHILGVVRDPRHNTYGVVERFTENIDVFPTLCEAMGLPVPAQCDGLPLTPLLAGETPPFWRDAAHWEFDWRFSYIANGTHPWPWDRRLERQNLAVRRDAESAYVQCGDGSWLCFDLVADPGWRTKTTDPARVLEKAQAMLTWRANHADRTMTGMLVEKGGIGRWPAMPDRWGKDDDASDTAVHAA